MMKPSESQLKTLRWVANNSVWIALLDRRGYGNRRRVVRSLYRAGLVEESIGGLIRPTPAGWKLLTKAAAPLKGSG